MDKHGIRQDTITYSAVISAMGKGDQWEKAVHYFNAMFKDGIRQDTITYSAVISAMEKGDQWEKAERYFLDCRANDIEPDDVTYSALFEALEGTGQHARADAYFMEHGGRRSLEQRQKADIGMRNPQLAFGPHVSGDGTR